MRLSLRPVRPTDEQVVRDAHEQLRTDNFEFALGLDNDMAWVDYIELLDRRLNEPPEPWVPSTFLLAVVDDNIVGRTSIRHGLNDYLHAVGGHIGFGVLPSYRRRGYATEILRQSIVIARSHGVDRVPCYLRRGQCFIRSGNHSVRRRTGEHRRRSFGRTAHAEVLDHLITAAPAAAGSLPQTGRSGTPDNAPDNHGRRRPSRRHSAARMRRHRISAG